jgi:hypothetical protein
MRFKRSDLAGMAIATLAPVALFLLFLNAYDLWDHHGSPLLAIMSTNVAIVAGLIGAFARFIKNWDVVGGLIGGLLLVVIAVLVMQRTGADGTALATGLKWAGVLLFLALNVALIWQFLKHGVEPMLIRRDERRRAAQQAQ